MNEHEHTPGPWRVSDTGIDVVCDPDARPLPVVACQHVTGKDNGEATANARLIAAAPDMLAALERIHRRRRTDKPITHGDLDQVRDAITKATGRAS